MPSPFRRIAPQVVEHASGWRVQIADRFHVEYVNGLHVLQIPADLDGPVVRVATPDAPIAFSPPLERALLPQVEQIREACRELLEY